MSAQVWALVLLAGAVASAETFGSITTIEQFPSLAQVEFYDQGSWLQQCAATIITNRHLLSAATCFYGVDYHPTIRRVRVGTSTRGVGGQVYGVEAAHHHYDFGTLGLDADITVVVLVGYLAGLGVSVQQAPILGQGIELPFGLAVNHAGWGTTAEGGKVSSDDLYSVDLFVNDHDTCLMNYFGKQYITENMVCVGLNFSQGRDMDETDTGTPLFYQGTLVGLLSFGKDDSDDDYPVVATNVGSYTDWIIQTAV